MTQIPNAAQKVPLMFRAQIGGRSQLQYVADTDINQWADEWIDKAYPEAPDFGEGVETRVYQLNWRFITNSGQDDGMIRPVMGAYGWPFYPGSSMKGIFRRACTPPQADNYCGRDLAGGDFQPGILRFHGGYPVDDHWQENLVDIVHPQQDWQVKTNNKEGGAFVQISLYQPQLRFGISSTKPLSEAQWQEVWEIWEKALSTGIGSRVSAGYGQPQQHKGKTLYRTDLKGQGAASKLLDNTGEFRPNIFKAALRGHALRLFGGLTDADTAEQAVEDLFGGVSGTGTVGLLAMSFRENERDMGEFGAASYAVPTYEVEGRLSWFLTRSLSDSTEKALQNLIKALMRFGMVLGGFGKSWRRADHRLFYPDYYPNWSDGTGGDRKPLIGCHWQWTGERALIIDSKVRKVDQIAPFLDDVRQTAQDWLEIRKFPVNHHNYAQTWREAWHPDKVQVWGRAANHPDDCEAIRWLHQPYFKGDPQYGIPVGNIYKSTVTGQVGCVGRLWHRMYPVVLLKKNPDNPKRPIPHPTRRYLEILTLFPDNSQDFEQFLTFLEDTQKQFTPLWGSNV